MNELQIITNNFTPAKVDFNYAQISNQLDVLLDKYKGLVFTEETLANCKKTIAELRKGQKSLDDFRKKTKKELTKSVTEFEGDCKKLYQKFDNVIDPLVEQSNFYEEQRRDEKKLEVQKIIDELIKKENLKGKFADSLIIQPEYLNKSTTLKSIKEDLTERAKNWGLQQDNEDANKELIKTKVQLANAKYNVNLSETPYIRLVEYENVEDIETKIVQDAERESYVEPEVVPIERIITAPTPKKNEEIYMERYEVNGTDKQLQALEDYLDFQGLEWKSID